jgi:hypothetical protein
LTSNDSRTRSQHKFYQDRTNETYGNSFYPRTIRDCNQPTYQLSIRWKDSELPSRQSPRSRSYTPVHSFISRYWIILAINTSGNLLCCPACLTFSPWCRFLWFGNICIVARYQLQEEIGMTVISFTLTSFGGWISNA